MLENDNELINERLTIPFLQHRYMAIEILPIVPRTNAEKTNQTVRIRQGVDDRGSIKR